jgi:fructose/tagatose bisphosphate aldolase
MIEFKYFIGPMSKNVVDTIIEFCNKTNNTIGLIPSRRQIEWDGGYVNNWTTKEFTEYIKSKTDKILLVRDHSGPKQGQIDDDGYFSLSEDCKCLDIIHIDPWKKYQIFSEGVEETIKMIKYCHNLNPDIQYEVGTEEAIRRFESYELNDLVHQLKSRLKLEVFNQIKYLVIQSGTSLKGINQTGNYDSIRLKEMIDVCKYHNLISKEHNGDYIPVSIINEKFKLGLDCINIAPEFGLVETLTYLDEIEKNWDFGAMENFWKICFESKKWKKWVNESFDPYIQKRDLIKICGHYVLSYPEFIKDIKNKFPNIDQKIKNNIKNKLNELYGY